MTSSALYVNQLDYENVEYRTHASNPGDEKYYKHGNISCAGCGFLDPAFRKDKFNIPGRREYVRVNNFTLYSSPEAVALDTQNRDPAYYLFYAS